MVKELRAPFEEQPVWVVAFYAWEEHMSFLGTGNVFCLIAFQKFIKGTCVLRHSERNVTSPRPLSPRALYSQETDLSTEKQSDVSDLEDSCDKGCAKRDTGSDQSEYDRFHGGCWGLA